MTQATDSFEEIDPQLYDSLVIPACKRSENALPILVPLQEMILPHFLTSLLNSAPGAAGVPGINCSLVVDYLPWRQPML